MLRKLQVQVTDKHINSGHRGNCYFCPVAMAISDAIGNKSYKSVSISFVKQYLMGCVSMGAVAHISGTGDYQLSQDVFDWIYYYDENHRTNPDYNPQPFSFEMFIDEKPNGNNQNSELKS